MARSGVACTKSKAVSDQLHPWTLFPLTDILALQMSSRTSSLRKSAGRLNARAQEIEENVTRRSWSCAS